MHNKTKIFLLILVLSAALFSALAGASYHQFSNKMVIAFGADADQKSPQPIWDSIIATNPDLFLFLGDNVYIDSTEESVMRAAYAMLGSVPGFRRMRESAVPIMATWDDHDYGEDDAGSEFPAKEISQQVFLDFFGEPLSSPRRTREGIYNARIFGEEGRRVQVIALDTRYFRTDKTMLGEDQWSWLEAELARPAELRIIMSSIQFITRDNAWENWTNVKGERTRFIELIIKTGAEGVLFVSGDRHIGELAVMNAGIGYPLFDLTTGSLNKVPKRIPSEKNLHRIEDYPAPTESFGLITLEWGVLSGPHVLLEIKDLGGASIIRRKIPLRMLRKGILPIGRNSSEKNKA